MGKFEIGIILIIIIIVTLSSMTFEYALDKGLHNETCIIQDKYEDEYTTLQPMPMGKAGIMTVLIEDHDYYFNTTKGVIPVNSKIYNSYNVSDTLNVSVNDKGRVQVILN